MIRARSAPSGGRGHEDAAGILAGGSAADRSVLDMDGHDRLGAQPVDDHRPSDTHKPRPPVAGRSCRLFDLGPLQHYGGDRHLAIRRALSGPRYTCRSRPRDQRHADGPVEHGLGQILTGRLVEYAKTSFQHRFFGQPLIHVNEYGEQVR